MILYHGSEKIIEKPEAKAGRIHNDYGQGFYCTRHKELACEWAVEEDRNGFVNKYELDETGLKIIDLNSDKYTILHWISILLEHRTVKMESKAAVAGLEFLKKNYHVDISKYDLVFGYRADDSYFAFARAFATNQISVEQLEKAMYLGDLGQQVFLRSEKAFKKLKFMEAYPVNSLDFYHLKKNRDQKARNDYDHITSRYDASGKYIVDLIREEAGNGASL